MKRPDSTDWAIAADKAQAKHHRCVCGDRSPCQCTPVHTPSPGWRRPDWWLATWSDLRMVYAHIAASKAEALVTTRAHDHNRDEFSPDCPGCCHGGALTGAEAMRLYRALAEQSAATQTSARALARKIDKIGRNMASQADVDAIAAALHQEDSDLNAAVTGITQKLADLQAAVDAGQPVDLSGLQAEVDSLRGAVDSAAALVPAPAAPPADGGDGSAPVDSGDGSAPSDGGDVPSA